MSFKILTILFFSLELLILSYSCSPRSHLQEQLQLAQDFSDKHQYEDAYKVYQKLKKLNLNKNLKQEIIFQMAKIESVYLSEYKKSYAHLQELASMSSGDTNWQFLAYRELAFLNIDHLNQFNEAADYFDKLTHIAKEKDQKDYFEFKKVDALLKGGVSNKVEKLLLKMSQDKSHKYQSKAGYELGVFYFESAKWNEAITFFLNYLKQNVGKDEEVRIKFLIANAYESLDKLVLAYNLYASIINDYPNPELIKKRMNTIYERRVSRRR